MASQETSEKVHLLVLVHGMWGNPSHLAEMSRIYREIRGVDKEDAERGPGGERLHIMVSETNKDTGTYDGIDWGGERVTEEILAEVKQLEAEGKTVTRFSITGYSLGGLIARYVIGILSQKRFFDSVTPVSFTTVATPHLGQILYPSLRSKVFAYFGTRLLSRTGEQLYVVDNWAASGRPLVDILADPERIFFQALSSFLRVRFYANSVNDVTVPYLTAAAEVSDPFHGHSFNGIKIEVDETYSPVISSFEPPETPKPKPPGPAIFSSKWFRNHVPPLPPLLQFKFPGSNVVIVTLLPIIIPTLISFALIRLSLDNHKSRLRVKTLEKDESYRERLVHLIGHLERTIEDAAIDYMDDPGDKLRSSQTLLSGTISPDTQEPPEPVGILSQVQRKIAVSLNTLPNLKKELVFIDPVTNSHAVIIARDVKRFDHHERGWGVLRHLADHFVM